MATRSKKPTQTTTSNQTTTRISKVTSSQPAQAPKPQISISEPIIDHSYKAVGNHPKSIIHTIYCYTMVGVGVIALSFGLFNVTRAFIVKNYYPNVDDFSLLVQDQCKFQYTIEGQKELNEEEKNNCIQQEKARSDEQKLRNFQRETIQGSLISIISLLIILVHYRLLK